MAGGVAAGGKINLFFAATSGPGLPSVDCSALHWGHFWVHNNGCIILGACRVS